MPKLAVLGGKPVFAGTHTFPAWPISSRTDERRLLKVLRSGQWGLGAPATEEFAARFARELGSRHVLPVSTGTAALELAVKALGIGPGDEVIVPAYTFIASATCVLQMEAVPVFADIDPETFVITPAEIRRLLTRRTRAVIPVHFGGNPCDLRGIMALSRRHGFAVIEDAAHAHGMRYRGRGAGTVGQAGCFSFQTSKNMTAGEGGALVTDSQRLYDLARSFHSFGRMPGREWYEHHTISWNQRITGLQSALLLGQLERLEAQTRTRFANGSFLNSALASIPGHTPQKDGDDHPDTRRAFHLYIWRYDARAVGVDRQTFTEALAAEGVRAFGGYPHPLHANLLFQERRFWHRQRFGNGPRRPGEPDYTKTRTPVTETLCAEAMWLPQSMLLASRRDMQGIVDAVAKVTACRDELLRHARRRGARRR